MFSLHNCTKLSAIVIVIVITRLLFCREKASYPVTATVTPLQANNHGKKFHMSAAVKYGPNHQDIIYLFTFYFTASVLSVLMSYLVSFLIRYISRVSIKRQLCPKTLKLFRKLLVEVKTKTEAQYFLIDFCAFTLYPPSWPLERTMIKAQTQQLCPSDTCASCVYGMFDLSLNWLFC